MWRKGEFENKIFLKGVIVRFWVLFFFWEENKGLFFFIVNLVEWVLRGFFR